ncbi:MAG TPA: DMT family transporter [Bacteroidota bacterium]|nr:DMT family transporter [Bacteroidota bacterium]
MIGELSALLTAVFWTLSASVFASATVRAGSVAVNVVRLVIAAVYLAIWISISGAAITLSTSQVVALGVSGVIGLAFGDSFLFRAFHEIGARVTMLIMATSPAVAAVLAYLFLHESLSLLGSLGILVTLVGIGVVVMEGGRENASSVSWRGVFFAVLASIGQGTGLIFAKAAFVEGPIDGFVATLVRIAASLVIMVPVGMVASRSTSGFHVLRTDRRALGLTAVGALFGPFFGITFSLIAVANTGVGVAATLMSTVPILMLPLVHFVNKERLSWRAISGAFVAVAGVAILFLRR